MGKGEKTGLGRALVKHYRHMIIESKEKGQDYRRQNKKVLQSVTDVSDIDAVIGDADEKDRVFSAQHSDAKLLTHLDSSSEASITAPQDSREQQMKEEEIHASSLRVPRRPSWNSEMTVEELDANERQAFLSWRRSLAKLEENEKLVLTPFEKNLDIWRQLWRVVERSDLLVTVVDARNPLFYRCSDLEAYVKEIDEHKRTMLLINKADLLPLSVRENWANYFHLNGILFLFWSAKAASGALEGKQLIMPEESADADADTKIYGREELLARLQSEAEKIVSMRSKPGSSMSGKSDSHSDSEESAGTTPAKSVMVGFVGYPNVGKSSTINALVGEKRTGVTSTPGKTKHFQTLIISDRLTLCDCPGLVFPSFTSSRYEMIASGVLPIDRMTEHRAAVEIVANRVPRDVIEKVYKISLPKPKSYERQSRPPTAAELLRTYCASRGYVSSRGLPDETRASRQMLKDYIDGKLPHFRMPPGTDDKAENEDVVEPISSEVPESDSSGDEHPSDDELESTPNLEHVLEDMDSFDMANGLVPRKELTKKKPPRAPHKQHKKPQRKKDRSWRVQNAEVDGMPVVRVYQKPANTGPLKP